MAERRTVVAPPDAGRLDAWLATALPLTRSRIQALIKDGAVRIGGQPARASLKLKGGETVEIDVPPPAPSELAAQDIPVPVLHLDDAVIVVDKPAGLVVHPARGHAEGTLVNALLHLLQQAGGDPERPGVVHRLDKGTSGVLVVARTPGAHAHLAAQLADRSMSRRYLALVWGAPPASGTVNAPLGRHPRDRLRFAVVEGGKTAITHYERLATAASGAVSLLACRLETGRTHQIRVHLQHIGHPLLGDPLYLRPGGAPPAWRAALSGVDHQLLHAFSLGFTHPTAGGRLLFSAPPPADFLAVAAAAGLEVPSEVR